jgi:hypothetical protein
MKRMPVVALVLLAGQGGAVAAQPVPSRYDGVVRTEWLPDGRQMKLLDDFTYIDARGRKWKAPKGSKIDGASIPQVFWSTGGPYEGLYRDASVVHDYFCDENPKTAAWQSVHRMFYEAMLTRGVDRKRALVMYGAVRRFGPRWADPTLFKPVMVCESIDGKRDCRIVGPPPERARPEPTIRDRQMLEDLVDSGAVSSPDDIDALPE